MPSAQLVYVFTYGLEKALGTIAGKRDLTTGSLVPSLPLMWPCTGGTFSLTLRIRNTELGAEDKEEKWWGAHEEQGALPRVNVS